ncbi:MAG: MFS transporter [Dehalococcoidales bacterium]|nr:MFS transporter [Dehalococcoidales bacterium]
MGSTQKRSKIFYGWYIVAAGLLIQLYSTGFVQFGFTAVFEPVVAEFGWSYAQVSLAASLRGFEIGLLAPVVGFLVDRWGARKLIFAGGIILTAGCFLLSRVSSLAMFYVAFALLSVGMSTTTHTVVMTAVSNWFHKNLGVAIGITASGVGLGGLMVPLVTGLIDTLQWRNAMLVAGAGMLAVVLPLSLVMRHKPEDYGYLPDGEKQDRLETGASDVRVENIEISVSYKRAMRSRGFWHIAIAATCLTFMVSAVTTHVMPYFSSLGVARSVSSLVALAVPLVSIGGRLSAGWLHNRFNTRHVFATGYTLMAIGVLIFACIASGRMGLLVPFIITFSLGWGSNVTTRIAMQREYFGRGDFGSILGLISGVMMIGSMAGAPVAGWVFDTWGSYLYAWFGCAAIGLIATVLALTSPRPDSYK